MQHSLARYSDADFGEIQKPSHLPKEKCIAPRPLQSEDEQLPERDCRFVWHFKVLQRGLFVLVKSSRQSFLHGAAILMVSLVIVKILGFVFLETTLLAKLTNTSDKGINKIKK